MNELTLTNFNGVETIDSRLVAEATGKRHADLIRDITKYCGYLNESKIALVDFFIESTYTDGKGETRPCYLCTRKGCEMIANKMTGAKGVTFTAYEEIAALLGVTQKTICQRMKEPWRLFSFDDYWLICEHYKVDFNRFMTEELHIA